MKPDYISVQVGDIVTFGSYWQSSSKHKDPINWQILDVNDGEALVISTRILDCRPYNDEGVSGHWGSCSLRNWLNYDFLDEVIPEKYNSPILHSVLLTDLPTEEDSTGSKCLFRIRRQVETFDYFFLLSYSEIGYVSSIDPKLKCVPTPYALNQGVCQGNFGSSPWWLRDLHDYGYEAYYVPEINEPILLVHDSRTISYVDTAITVVGVRPAVRISLLSKYWQPVQGYAGSVIGYTSKPEKLD